MSFAQSPSQETYQCEFADCSDSRTPQTSHAGSFCSQECHYRHIGRGLLRRFITDHRYCATSWTKLKDVYPPGRKANSKHITSITDDPSQDKYAVMDDIPECAIGRAIGTPLADYGEREYGREERVGIGLISPEGPGHHKTIDRPNHVGRALDFVDNLSHAVTTLLHEGQHDKHHDREILIQEILRTRLRRGPETMIRQDDYERALGRAIAECPR